MNWLAILIALLAGFVLGLICAFILRIVQGKTAKQLADELYRENEEQRNANVNAILESVKSSFGDLSLQALSKSTDEFLKLAKSSLESESKAGAQELDKRKSLIDQQLQRMNTELQNVSTLVKELEKDRRQKFGEVTTQLKHTTEQTTKLMETANKLREILASSQARGQWGERMAEDVLRLAGFIENINYTKQQTIESVGKRPDFTFLLPRGLKLNMDVKFPLDNYAKYVESESDQDKTTYRNKFLLDVKARIKEVASREYVNPEQNTTDYALLLIPNEQIFAFVHEQDSSIIDEGIKNKVIFCSPITLFAVLAVVRVAIDNFALEQTSNEILSLLGTFKKQWTKFLVVLDGLGKRIASLHSEYEKLTSTRRRQLDRPLQQIEEIRMQRSLPLADVEPSEIVSTEESEGDMAKTETEDESANNSAL